MCSESCFLVFLQEKEHGKYGPKGRENEEKRNCLKENATKTPPGRLMHGRTPSRFATVEGKAK